MALVVFDVSGTLHDDFVGAPMYDGLMDVFKKLQQNDIQIALATNLSRQGVEHFIQTNGLEGFISESMTMSEAPPKPHPKMLEDVILKTGENAKETLMVGDSSGDIAMAKACKVASVAVCWDGAWRQEILAQSPDYKVDKIDNLWQIFSEFFKIEK